ncbi:PREDICTED: uncharacterized protein LOC106114943, partial [Papilio xuthus]|uniref:Uncharacterized protein LOC106114943 n=1 Tax=Papilio xuthus TaxID=66420 RepID=A0AAJ7E5L6_PAPXU
MLGIKDSYEKQEKNEILNTFNKCISVNEEGRYEIGLMWKDNSDLDSNYDQAYRRLMSTTKKLENTNIIKEYGEVIKEWQKEGIIEVVKEDNINEGHYLPHHAVIKWDRATTKIRPVFDASCKGKNKKSLNDCIDKGPNLIEEIPKLLLNFRSGAYGVTADIKKAFLQISISPHDRKYLKLLWWKENQREIVTYQHARVPFGVACSPFLLAVTIYHHLEKEKNTFEATAKRLRDSFYVDNCVTSFDTPEEVKSFEEEAKVLMMKGKFELRAWMTNSTQEVDPVSVLGVQWNRYADDLCCNVNIKSVPERITKRDLLSITQQIFDPIGFLSPVTL